VNTPEGVPAKTATVKEAFAVTFFDAADAPCGVKLLSLDVAPGLPGRLKTAVLKAWPDSAVVAHVWSSRDICCSEIRK
jgi:hypothetical protein